MADESEKKMGKILKYWEGKYATVITIQFASCDWFPYNCSERHPYPLAEGASNITRPNDSATNSYVNYLPIDREHPAPFGM